MKLVSILLILLTSLVLSESLQGQDFSKVVIEPIQLTDHIYYLKGRGGNIGVLTGPEGVVMIDNQFAPLADKIEAAIKTLSDAPIRYVINTHFHGDHSGGNEAFSKKGGILLAHENVRARLSTDQYQAFFDRKTPAKPKTSWPVITFGEGLRLHLNGETIDIIHHSSAHTDGDALVYFRTSNVLHAGDVFVTYGFPFIDASSGGSIEGFIAYLDFMIDLIDDETKVIPGHGDLSNRQDVIAFRDRLKHLYTQVMIRKRMGQSMDKILAAGITEPFEEEWGKGFIKGRDFLMLLSESLGND
ncbi:MAG: MBL fold metallo-hydrolase [Bacteroidota bacterium]